MTEHDTRRRFLPTSGGLVTLAFAGCLGDGGTDDQMSDVDDGHEYPAAEDVVQVTVTRT